MKYRAHCSIEVLCRTRARKGSWQFRTLTRALLVSLLLVPFGGCAGRQKSERPPVPRGPQVVDVAFQGNLNFKDKELLEAIRTEESSKLAFWEKEYLNAGEVDKDRDRIRTFYQMHGYFDVSVTPPRVVPARKEGRKEAPDMPPGNPPLTLDQPVPGPGLNLDPQQPPSDQLAIEKPKTDTAGAAPAPEGTVPATGADEDGAREEEESEEDNERVRVIFTIAEGNRYKVNEVRVDFAAGLPPALVELVQKQLWVPEGAYFDADRHAAAEQGMLDLLRDASYAWAEVKRETVVIPQNNSVRLHYRVDAGPPCVFGTLQIEGLKEVREELVIERAERYITAGRPYTQQALTNLSQQLYDLQLFQTVLVTPTEESRGRVQVDVQVQVTERPFRLVRAGGGFTQEIDWQEVYANTGWDHNYFGRRLVRLNLFGQFGWAFSPSLFSGDAYSSPNLETLQVDGRNGPIADLRATVTLPDYRARLVNIHADARYVVGQTQSFGYMSPQLRLSISRPIQRHLVTTAGLGVEYYGATPDELSQRVFDEETIGDPDDEDDEASRFIQFKGLLTYLEQSAIYDQRDNILAPSRGFYAALNLQEAGLLGNFSFIKAVPDVRGYFPAVEDTLTLAGRLSTGVIVPLANEGAPAVLHFETGGGASVRGFGRDQITLFTGENCAEASPNQTEECPIATGGNLMYQANLEARARLGQFGAVVFADAGHVALEDDGALGAWVRPRFSDFSVGVGLGLRYYTVIGPIRLDFGWRLVDPFSREAGLQYIGGGCPCALHLGIGEAF